MRKIINGLPATYQYEETVLGYYALFIDSYWCYTGKTLIECVTFAQQYYKDWS